MKEMLKFVFDESINCVGMLVDYDPSTRQRREVYRGYTSVGWGAQSQGRLKPPLYL